jgi:hypothetical protein
VTGVAFLRTASELLVTTDALPVKRIRAFGHIRVLALRFVALDAGRNLGFSRFQGMMAVAAGKTVARGDRMGFVVKQNPAGNTLKHHPHRAIRCFCRKGGIADNTHNEEHNGESVSQPQLFLVKHGTESFHKFVLIGPAAQMENWSQKSKSSSTILPAGFQVFFVSSAGPKP